MDRLAEDYQQTSRLVEGINIRELLENETATFQVLTNIDDALEEQQTSYHNEDLIKFVNVDCIDASSDNEDDLQHGVAPGATPFERIAMKMNNVDPEGKLKKRILKEGRGTIIPNTCQVEFHHNFYLEFGDDPYDSSYLRGRTVKGFLNRGNFIPGVELAIATMRKGEIAEFLVHPDLGYGEMGCPPRIPKSAELLFQIQLIDFVERADESENIEQDSVEGVKKFQALYKEAKALLLDGNKFFKQKNIASAINRYKKAANMLVNTSVADEEEENQQKKLLLKLYIDLAICYNEQKTFRLACVACRDALYIDETNAKANFHFGRALMYLGDFPQSRKYLLRAKRKEAHNPAINEELIKLDKRQKVYNSNISSMFKNMFVSPKSTEKPDEKCEKSSMDPSSEISIFLREFLKNPNETSLALPSGLTPEETEEFHREAKKLDLFWKVTENDGNKQIYVQKKL